MSKKSNEKRKEKQNKNKVSEIPIIEINSEDLQKFAESVIKIVVDVIKKRKDNNNIEESVMDAIGDEITDPITLIEILMATDALISNKQFPKMDNKKVEQFKLELVELVEKYLYNNILPSSYIAVLMYNFLSNLLYNPITDLAYPSIKKWMDENKNGKWSKNNIPEGYI